MPDLEPPSPKRLKATEPESPRKSTMIILVGLPGAGKSTFATHLIQQSPQRFARINQDSVENGKRGTRDMCINTATSALRQGINVIIDRTNVSSEQRKYFLDTAAAAGLDPSNVHCVFLNLPVKACGSRAADRQNHEGGVFGPKAYGTVGMMQKQLKPPLLSEGFASVLECQNDAELDAALALWVTYTTQIDNREPNLLDLNVEWEKMKPKRKGGSNGNDAGGGGGGGGLQKLDKFFRKNPNSGNRGDGTEGSNTSAADTPTGATSRGENAFSMMMKASKQQQQQQQQESHSPFTLKTAITETTATRHKFRFAPALYNLQRYLRNPEQLFLNSSNNAATTTATTTASDNDLTVLYCDPQCIIIPDKYPKSRYHILVLARDQRLQGPLDLTSADAALVQHMKDVGLKWATEHAPAPNSNSIAAGGGGEEERFSVGFHSVPSMRQLHLHVLTKDYHSVSLKNKKHWNSFTTEFFLDVDWVLAQLEILSHASSSQQQQYLDYDVAEKEALLKGPMVCPRCRAVLARMPDVKAHVAVCSGKHS